MNSSVPFVLIGFALLLTFHISFPVLTPFALTAFRNHPTVAKLYVPKIYKSTAFTISMSTLLPKKP